MLVGKRAAYFPCCFGISVDMVLELAINIDYTFISSVKNSFAERRGTFLFIGLFPCVTLYWELIISFSS